MTYTMITTIEGQRGTQAETNTRLALGDVEAIKQAATWLAEPGDTITHQVIAEQ